jgi:hypothetical protein
MKSGWWWVYRTFAVVFLFLCEHTVWSQRNFIDVPSSDIVEKSHYFSQVQTGISKKELNTSVLFTYGLGYNWEVGIGIDKLVYAWSEGMETSDDFPSDNPAVLFNIQKGFILTSSTNLGIGTRSGFTHARKRRNSDFASLSYLNCHSSLVNDALGVTGGLYYGNEAFLGDESDWGIMGGVEVSIIPDRFNFQADFFSGDNDISSINTGLEWTLPRDWRITLGVRFPFPGSETQEYGALIQLAKN